MSATSSAPAFVDPLAQEGVPSAQPRRERRQSPATRERAALLAPDVAGHMGAEAIDLVRSKGLIAAIETMEIVGDAQQGLVIEQDPPAGTRMTREGVVTLRVARTPVDPQDTEDDDAARSKRVPRTTTSEGEDDTADWFAELSPSPGGAVLRAGASAPCRHRKHRRAAVPVKEMVFDTPPDPRPAICDALPDERQNRSPQPVRPGLFGSAITTLLVRLPTPSVSPTWRRRGLVVAGTIVGLLVFTQGGGSYSHHQVFAPLALVSAPPLRAATTPAPPHSQYLRRTPHDRRSTRRPAVETRRLPSGRAPRESIVATASIVAPAPTEPASPVVPPVTSTPTATPSRSVQVGEQPGRFSYLGK
jgi:hypothetical protein